MYLVSFIAFYHIPCRTPLICSLVIFNIFVFCFELPAPTHCRRAITLTPCSLRFYRHQSCLGVVPAEVLVMLMVMPVVAGAGRPSILCARRWTSPPLHPRSCAPRHAKETSEKLCRISPVACLLNWFGRTSITLSGLQQMWVIKAADLGSIQALTITFTITGIHRTIDRTVRSGFVQVFWPYGPVLKSSWYVVESNLLLGLIS